MCTRMELNFLLPGNWTQAQWQNQVVKEKNFNSEIDAPCQVHTYVSKTTYKQNYRQWQGVIYIQSKDPFILPQYNIAPWALLRLGGGDPVLILHW